jgi:hypothetical protein
MTSMPEMLAIIIANTQFPREMGGDNKRNGVTIPDLDTAVSHRQRTSRFCPFARVSMQEPCRSPA